jgi:hypothetical protein
MEVWVTKVCQTHETSPIGGGRRVKRRGQEPGLTVTRRLSYIIFRAAPISPGRIKV